MEWIPAFFRPYISARPIFTFYSTVRDSEIARKIRSSRWSKVVLFSTAAVAGSISSVRSLNLAARLTGLAPATSLRTMVQNWITMSAFSSPALGVEITLGGFVVVFMLAVSLILCLLTVRLIKDSVLAKRDELAPWGKLPHPFFKCAKREIYLASLFMAMGVCSIYNLCPNFNVISYDCLIMYVSLIIMRLLTRDCED